MPSAVRGRADAVTQKQQTKARGEADLAKPG
jgi:hypothetical protein